MYNSSAIITVSTCRNPGRVKQHKYYEFVYVCVRVGVCVCVRVGGCARLMRVTLGAYEVFASTRIRSRYLYYNIRASYAFNAI